LLRRGDLVAPEGPKGPQAVTAREHSVVVRVDAEAGDWEAPGRLVDCRVAVTLEPGDALGVVRAAREGDQVAREDARAAEAGVVGEGRPAALVDVAAVASSDERTLPADGPGLGDDGRRIAKIDRGGDEVVHRHALD